MIGKDDKHSSLGTTKKIGIQRHSRWTFWQAGIGNRKPLVCSKCGKRVYKLQFTAKHEGGTCEECKNKQKI